MYLCCERAKDIGREFESSPPYLQAAIPQSCARESNSAWTLHLGASRHSTYDDVAHRCRVQGAPVLMALYFVDSMLKV